MKEIKKFADGGIKEDELAFTKNAMAPIGRFKIRICFPEIRIHKNEF